MDTPPSNPKPKHVLTLQRRLKAPRETVWRCWTEPDLLARWFCPKPWFVTDVRMDLRPGGVFAMAMNGPDGEVVANTGVFLAIEPKHRLVTTDAFQPGWIPSDRAFMTAEMTFDDIGDGHTGYVARAMHWDAEARQQHEAMGFAAGWGKAADQLEELAQSIS